MEAQVGFCPQCSADGTDSYLTQGSSVALSGYYFPYYDEEGGLHSEVVPEIKTYYACSLGHQFFVMKVRDRVVQVEVIL